ncbi:hypothetical protein PISMIDRAFT_686076 [Pisolithus microcarpus 441]|uniref:Uncharacterized protein n=1 Tax=Pisolithus microcarpus 441 TaxID=765257 RepID=A0A0C9XW80_9AGAM|nr:hypothetical protein PISMIDRAFT_686076 [Pisolithus microcarpus 441]
MGSLRKGDQNGSDVEESVGWWGGVVMRRRHIQRHAVSSWIWGGEYKVQVPSKVTGSGQTRTTVR